MMHVILSSPLDTSKEVMYESLLGSSWVTSSMACCTMLRALESFPKKLLLASEQRRERMMTQVACAGWVSVESLRQA